jgi:hypothetical protein
MWSLMALLLIFFRSQGLRGWPLLASALVSLFPAFLISMAFIFRIIPPRIEPYQPVGMGAGSEEANTSTSQPRVREKKNPLGGSDDALL